jgi:ABC-type nickel/cobalt efflux system permease component RcnA
MMQPKVVSALAATRTPRRNMPPIAELIQQGSTNLWLFIPTAILIGALHGLEPGHSKTLMAAFIVAIKGTPGQAALLGVCAALSHSIVVCSSRLWPSPLAMPYWPNRQNPICCWPHP